MRERNERIEGREAAKNSLNNGKKKKKKRKRNYHALEQKQIDIKVWTERKPQPLDWRNKNSKSILYSEELQMRNAPLHPHFDDRV